MLARDIYINLPSYNQLYLCNFASFFGYHYYLKLTVTLAIININFASLNQYY